MRKYNSLLPAGWTRITEKVNGLDVGFLQSHELQLRDARAVTSC